MITRLLTGILACVLVPLGIAFTVVGLVADDVDSGSPEGFLVVGPSFLAVGMLLVAVFAVLSRRAGAAPRRRQEGVRTMARIVHAHLLAGVRIGVLVTYDLTVTFPAAGEVTRRVSVAPNVQLTAGEEIEIAYDPADPSNFEPAASIDQGRPR